MKKKSEQRTSTRVPVKLQVDWKSEGHFLFENASNISEHGIFIETLHPMKIGTRLELQFSVPHVSRKIEVLGEVTWINPHRKDDDENLNPGMGVRFLNLSELDRETILSLIKRVAVL